MARLRVRFIFPAEQVKQPIIHQLGQQFQVVTNIRRADIREHSGWALLELSGNETEIENALDWVRSTGVRVDPVAGDVVEG